MASDINRDNPNCLVSESPSDTLSDSVRVDPDNLSNDSEILTVSVNDLIYPNTLTSG